MTNSPGGGKGLFMNFSNLIFLGFVGSVFMLWRFSKYSRILISRKDLSREETERYQGKAQRALAMAGGLLLLGVAALVLAIIFQ